MSKVKHSRSFRIKQPIDSLFPLFSAEGEKLWVPEWDYENVMGETQLHEDYIFLTESHDYASTKAIWLVKRYEPDRHHVQFYKVEPEDKVATIVVQCESLGADETEVAVSYEYVGLNAKGNAFVDGFDAAEFKHYIDEWEQLLNVYFDA